MFGDFEKAARDQNPPQMFGGAGDDDPERERGLRAGDQIEDGKFDSPSFAAGVGGEQIELEPFVHLFLVVRVPVAWVPLAGELGFAFDSDGAVTRGEPREFSFSLESDGSVVSGGEESRALALAAAGDREGQGFVAFEIDLQVDAAELAEVGVHTVGAGPPFDPVVRDRSASGDPQFDMAVIGS